MRISYYKKSLILVAIYYIIGFTIWIAFPPTSTPYTPLIVIDDAAIEILLLFLVIIPLSSIIGSYVIGYFLVPVFLFFHVKIYGKKLEYGFQKILFTLISDWIVHNKNIPGKNTQNIFPT